MRRSSFVAPTDRANNVPDALSWRKKADGETAPKGLAAWSAASSLQFDRAVVDAGPYGVIDLAVMEPIPDVPGPKPQLGVVWWDRRSLRDEDDDHGAIQTSFVPAAMTEHVSLASTSGSAGSLRSAAAPHEIPAPAVDTPSAMHHQHAAPVAPPEAELRPRPAGDHESLAEVAADVAVPAAPATAAPAPAAPALAAPTPAAPTPAAPAPQGFVDEPIVPPAPPVSATLHPELDDADHKRHARRSRHVELVPKLRGRADPVSDASHPRRARLRRRRSRRRVIVSVILIVAAFVVTLIVQNLIVTPFTVPSSSMENTLHTDDRILVDKVAYSINPIHRGDVVVFEDPGGWLDKSRETVSGDGKDYLVKRVVGVPGDHVSCCSTAGRLTVNGTEVLEPYTVVPEGRPATNSFDVTVPAGALWVLGDNRFNSRDSTQTQNEPTKGFVPIADVVGQAVLKLWPLSQIAPVQSAPELASIPAQACPT